ncbi:MAG TPA: glycosyltransferase family 2 protein, partial [Ktedonobacterales bacterium]|nr:glycosyltransferase family 2 protein [Ktedonobacterales bacterium]
MARVAFNIVTYNAAASLDACLTSVVQQDYRDFDVLVVDNASSDGTRDLLRTWQSRGVRVIYNDRNEYYARAHNQAIYESQSEFVLTLNPDVLLRRDYLTRVVQAFDLLPDVGAVNGKLLHLPLRQFHLDVLDRPEDPRARIDGAGLVMTRSRRPKLLGNRRRNVAMSQEPRYIFGVDGACATYRRAMLEDIALDGEYFDEDFVIYREDVDVAWRAQIRGWSSLVVPSAVGYHARGFEPGQRRDVIAAELKRHSVKNG